MARRPLCVDKAKKGHGQIGTEAEVSNTMSPRIPSAQEKQARFNVSCDLPLGQAGGLELC